MNLLLDELGKGPLHEENAEKLLEKVRRRLAEVRSEVYHAVEEKHKEQLPKWISEADKIAKDVASQANAMDAESERIKNLLQDWTESWNIAKVKKMQKDMEAAEARMKKLRPLADIHDALESLELTEQRHKRDYLKRAGLILGLDGSLRSLLNLASIQKEKPQTADEIESEEDDMDDFQLQESILKTLRDDLIVRKESLTYDLYEDWAEIFRWDTEKENSNRLIINIGPRFEDIVASLKMIDLLEKKMDHLGKCLFNYLFLPLLTEPGTTAEIADSEDQAEIVVTKSTAADQNKAQFSATVLDNCVRIFQLLKETSASDPNFAQHLTEGYVVRRLKELIVDAVLKPSVPASAAETPKFDRLLASCNVFLQNLKSAGLISEDESSFDEFSANVDVLFLAKRCQFILDQAHRLIGEDVQKTVQVGGETNVGDDGAALKKCLEMIKRQKGGEEKESTPLKLDFEKPLPPLSEFPRCRVSESVVSLLELILKTLDESCNASKPLTAARLYYCARSMMELYLDLMPVRHEHQLRMMPQATAVFYNDCYFLCHHLLTLGAIYEKKLLAACGVSSNVVSVTFIDFIPRLKELAAEYMDAQVQMQTKCLIDCLKPTEGFRNVSDKVRSGVCQKATKACSMQFQHIHRVWSQVLNSVLLMKFQGAMGVELLKHIVKTVVKLDDIAEADARIMHNMFTGLLAEIEGVFVIDKVSYAHRYCENSYYQFKEFLFVLNASLMEIEDRWTFGPLADCMDALDVKQLIRALFQNTDKRAAVIAKIK